MNDFARELAHPARAKDVHARLDGATLIGNPDRPIRAIGALSTRAPDVLTFCDATREAEEALRRAAASVIIVPARLSLAPQTQRTLIAVDDVRSAFIDIVDALVPDAARPTDPLPGIAAEADVHVDAHVSPLACIAAGVIVGAGTRIGPGAIVYADTTIGRDCVIGPNAVIGFCGLAYHDRADGRRSFFPHLAGVRIGDRVDVGAHTCICRGMLSHTTIGNDAKIGSLVYVSHGVAVGARAWLSAGTAIAGHSTIAARSLLGIGSVVVDNVCLGEEVVVGGGSVVTKGAPAGEKLYGVPAHRVGAMRRFGPTPRE